MTSNQKSDSQRLAALEGGAAVCILAGGEPATALRALLGVGGLLGEKCVPHVLNMAEHATSGEFGLTERLNRSVSEVGQVVALAHQVEPNGLSRDTLISASQTVERVTAHLFSPAELAAVIRGTGLQDRNLHTIRSYLLIGSGLLNERATPHVRQQLDRADQASRVVERLTPNLSIPDVGTRDRQADDLSNLDLRLGLVLRGEPAPMTAADLRAWFRQHRPDVLEVAGRQVRVLRALGESPVTGCKRVHLLLVRAIGYAGAQRLSDTLKDCSGVPFDLATEIQRGA